MLIFLLYIPHCLTKFGERAFSFPGSQAWNATASKTSETILTVVNVNRRNLLLAWLITENRF